MPTYEYACRSCGSQLEVVQSFTDEPLTTCGECGGSLRKVFGAVGISFKGSGFYKTDSRKGSSSSSSSSGSSPDGATKGADGAKEVGSKEGGTKDGGSKETKAKEPAASSAGERSSAATPAAKPASP